MIRNTIVFLGKTGSGKSQISRMVEEFLKTKGLSVSNNEEDHTLMVYGELEETDKDQIKINWEKTSEEREKE